MQYCPSCRIQIRGKKARCPLCQRELMESEYASVSDTETQGENEGVSDPGASSYDDDPFVQLPSPKVSFMLMVRTVTFICISLEIILGAGLIISGSGGWILAVMLFILLGWVDFRVAVYYRSNMIRMLTVQAYIIMAACLLAAHITKTGSWAVSWAVPSLFLLLIAVTFGAARAQSMELHEFILYPAFDFLMSLFQIIPIALGRNPVIAPAVICIAVMLILVCSLVIFRGKMLREAAEKYLHL